MKLKETILRVLDALELVAGSGGRALVSLARWVVERFVPDDAEVAAPVPVAAADGVAAAPDSAREFVESLFDAAIARVDRSLFKKVLEAAKFLVVNYALDFVWDRIFVPTPVAAAGGFGCLVPDDAVDKEACMLDAAAAKPACGGGGDACGG